MTSDELYEIDPAYAKWRDEEDRIRAGFFEYAYVSKFGPEVRPLMQPEDL